MIIAQLGKLTKPNEKLNKAGNYKIKQINSFLIQKTQLIKKKKKSGKIILYPEAIQV